MWTSQMHLVARPPGSLGNRTMHSPKNEANAKLAIISLTGKIITNKKFRRLQSRSISYCILRQLKTAFTVLKLLLTPRKKQSVQEWYRSRLLSSVFGCWLSFIRSEQAVNLQLVARGGNFHDRNLMQLYFLASVRRQIACSCLAKNMHLAVTYFSYLRLLESFETFSGTVARRDFFQKKIITAQKFVLKSMKSNCIGKKKKINESRLMIIWKKL